MLKHPTYQKAESLRTVSPSKLDNTLKNNSVLNTKCAEISTKWYVLFHFHNPMCAYNHHYNLHQNFSSANFHLTIPPALVHKIILTIISIWPYSFLKNKITRSLNIIFVDKKYDVIILSYYIFDLLAKSHHQSMMMHFRIRSQQEHKGKNMWLKCLVVVHQI